MGKCRMCKRTASYNLKGNPPRFCSDHKTSEMINTRIIICSDTDCNTGALYGYSGSTPLYCFKHKVDGMINLKFKSCAHANCISRPNFDFPNMKGLYCSLHKLPGMIDIKHKRCKHTDCDSINPVFDIPGGVGSYCATHRAENMINVRDKTCEFPTCSVVNPNFDIIGGKGRYCASHKLEGMINVRSPHCAHNNCNSVNPSFDFPNGKGIYCSLHKLEGMVDVKNKKCIEKGCDVYPSFGLVKGRPLYCALHKPEEMNITSHTKCMSCNTIASYGKPGNRVSHCTKHRIPGMIQRPDGKCTIQLCTEKAFYGPSFIPLHCIHHKTEEDNNLVEQECSSCHLITIVDHNNHCESCDPVTFKKARLIKQTALFNYLDYRGDLPLAQTTDTVVDKAVCGLERPDRVYDFTDKIIILECDEDQHDTRPCACEQSRMVNIGQMFGGVPVYFIRWNPDKYITKNSSIHCDILSVRHKLVGDFIYNIMNKNVKLPVALVSAIYLYYDNWNGLVDETWNILTEYEKNTLIYP